MTQNKNKITSEDIVATVDAGAAAGLIAPSEQAAIENVMDLESRLVPSAMTAREYVVYFTLDESYESIVKKIASSPHNKFPVCDRDIDHVIGYVDSKDILRRVIEGILAGPYHSGIYQQCARTDGAGTHTWRAGVSHH